MKQSIKTNIKKNNIKNFIISLPIVLFMDTIFISILLNVVNNFKELHLIVALIVFAFIAYLFTKKEILYLIYFLNPEKTQFVKKFKNLENLEKIRAEINKTIIYDDKKTVITNNYIFSKKNYQNLIEINGILGLYKTNVKYVLRDIFNKYSITIYDKYGESFEFEYSFMDDDKRDEIINYIHKQNKNARIGYNQQTLNYVEKNKIKY